MNHPIDRRALIRRSLSLAAAASAGSAISTVTAGETTATAAAGETESPKLGRGSVVLFQGDSITDARRSRDDTPANHPRALGDGYPMLIAAGLLRDHPRSALKVYNRGISGNKVPDLDARWQKDCLDLKPDLLSILIGVNDIWHKLGGRYDGTVETYQAGLRALLERTREALPETRIVICEPFVLRCGAVNDSWFPEFDQRRNACVEVARSMSLELVPFQSMFDEHTNDDVPPSYWAADGVHPTVAGHALMAATWRQVVGV